MTLRTLTLCSALAAGLFTAASASAQEAPNSLSPQESKAGWKLLFNGKNLEGWETHWGDDFKVENGALVCGGDAATWLGTTGSYGNFVLKLEFRGPENVNSGVFLRSQKEGQPHLTGYELQIWDHQPAGYTTGSLVGSLKASPTKIIPDGWNHYEITAEGDHFVVVLNGKTILDGRDSKHAAGVIGFQCQKNNRIEFRNIELLPKK